MGPYITYVYIYVYIVTNKHDKIHTDIMRIYFSVTYSICRPECHILLIRYLLFISAVDIDREKSQIMLSSGINVSKKT